MKLPKHIKQNIKWLIFDFGLGSVATLLLILFLIWWYGQ